MAIVEELFYKLSKARTSLKKTLLVGFLFIFFSNVFAQRNVVILIADDLGTDYFGFYEDHVDTADVPNIRSLLSDGVRFKNAMSNPVCSATRAGMLTGRYSFRTGVGAIVGSAAGSGQLDTSETTIPRLLDQYDSSIAKCHIGKWHLNNPTPAANLLFPNVIGYDHFEGPFIGALPDYSNWMKYTNGVASTITNYATTENVDNAVSWLKTQGNDPFFLWMAFNAPHSPYHLPPAGLYSDTTLSGTSADINNNPKKYFIAALEALDHEIGRLFDSLRVLNKLDSTDFIFVGDNGNATRTIQSANPLRAKGTVYQYGVHVPLIISGPSVVNPGRVSDALVNTVDLFATIPELFGDTNWQANIPVNKPIDSKSLMPILTDQDTSIRPWSFTEIFKTTTDSDDGKAMRNIEYKLINFDDGRQEFYDLRLDPNEANDLLLGTLTTVERFNYNYLCSEMNALTGSGSFCNASVGIVNAVTGVNDVIAFPNPFTSQIFINTNFTNPAVELRNCLGQIIYSGNDLSSQNFSDLPKGLYYLRLIEVGNEVGDEVVKLLK